MLYMLDIARVPCETSAVLRLYMVIGGIINILKMAIPIVLVVVATIEFVKMVLESEEKDSNSIKRIISKFIAAILVFFVPTLVSFY